MVNQQQKYRGFRLDNGLFVALQETPSKTISGTLGVWHGALNERTGEEGLAHFLEHTLVTGGSQKYTPKESDAIIGNFGYFNASTGRRGTSFSVEMLPEDTQLYLDFISESVFHPRFEQTHLDEERERVLREIADLKSNPAFNDHRIYDEAFFGKDSPHIYFVGGKESVIANASRSDLNAFHRRGYHPNNMDLILVGALPSNIEKLIEQNFGGFKSGVRTKVELPRNSSLNGPTIIHTRAPELYNYDNPAQSSAQLSMALVAPPESEEDACGVDILAYILGGDAHSRLVTALSRRKGIAYSIQSEYDGASNKGIIGLSGNVHALRGDEAIDTVFEEMEKLKNNLVPQDTLERLKKKCQFGLAQTFESNRSQLSAIEVNLETGLTLEHRLERLASVTPQQVRNAAIKYFPESRADGKYVLMLRNPLKED